MERVRKPDKAWEKDGHTFHLWIPGLPTDISPETEATLRVFREGKPVQMVFGSVEFCRRMARSWNRRL